MEFLIRKQHDLRDQPQTRWTFTGHLLVPAEHFTGARWTFTGHLEVPGGNLLDTFIQTSDTLEKDLYPGFCWNGLHLCLFSLNSDEQNCTVHYLLLLTNSVKSCNECKSPYF